MLIVGAGVSEGAAYDPETDSWREIANAPFPVGGERVPYPAHVWTGEELLVWEPSAGVMASYDPVSDEWSDVEAPPIPGSVGKLLIGDNRLFAFSNSPGPAPLHGAELIAGTWSLLPDANLSSDEYRVWAPPHLAMWMAGTVMVVSDSGRTGLAKEWQADVGEWVEIEQIPMNGCEFVPPPLAIDEAWYLPSCGVNWLVDSSGWMRYDGAPAVFDARYAVWTGDEVIVWGDPCCFGTGGRPFEIEAWRFSP